MKTPEPFSGFEVRLRRISRESNIENQDLVANMVLKSREDLQRLREQSKELVSARDKEGVKIVVGMGTCGIAAGAREVMAGILEELGKYDVKATVAQTGCIGMCEKEPLVDVQRPGEKRITYGKVKAADVPRIVKDHIVNGKFVENLVVARHDEV